jgi:hypothetical protein
MALRRVDQADGGAERHDDELSGPGDVDEEVVDADVVAEVGERQPLERLAFGGDAIDVGFAVAHHDVDEPVGRVMVRSGSQQEATDLTRITIDGVPVLERLEVDLVAHRRRRDSAVTERGAGGACPCPSTGYVRSMARLDTAPGLRIAAARVLVAGLCVAAAVALWALLAGSFDDTDWRAIGTSLGVGVFSSTAAAGALLRLRDTPPARGLGLATIAVSVLAFLTLLLALWVDADADGLWRAWGVAALAALCGSYASLVLRPLRDGDSPAIRWLSAVAVGGLAVDTAFGMLGVLGALDDVDWDFLGRALGALVVITLLATALLPILRRMARLRAAGAVVAAPTTAFGERTAPPARDGPLGRSAEIAAVAARLDAAASTPQLRSDVARLRELALDVGSPPSPPR